MPRDDALLERLEFAEAPAPLAGMLWLSLLGPRPDTGPRGTLVAYDGAQIAGTIAWRAGHSSLWVSPPYRRRGIGRELWARAVRAGFVPHGDPNIGDGGRWWAAVKDKAVYAAANVAASQEET